MSKLKVGDKASNFMAPNQNGEAVSLSSFQGKRVIMFFYPKDNTPGCTAEACSLRDGYPELKDKGFILVGISVDSVASHQKFASKHDFPFDLLADVDKKIVEDYGVWVDKSMYGRTYKGISRTTFILDENHVISHIIDKVDTKNAALQILGILEK